MPAVTLIEPELPNPPNVGTLAPDKVGPVTVKPKESSPLIVFLSIVMVPGVSKVASMKVHVTVPKSGTGKFVGENVVRPSVHEAVVRPQPIGMVVSDTV